MKNQGALYRLSLVIFLLYAGTSSAVLAQDTVGGVCLNESVSVCGKTVAVPPLGLGAITALTTPSPYMHDTFIVQCLSFGGILAVQIADSHAVTCNLQRCSPSAVSICGISVPVSGGTVVGNKESKTVPAAMLADQTQNFSFDVHCVDNGNEPFYQVDNSSEVSCNAFPCRDTTVELCGVSIPVAGGMSLGAVKNIAMPQPFHGDFAVECVGSGGNPPAYQIIEHDNVSCD